MHAPSPTHRPAMPALAAIAGLVGLAALAIPARAEPQTLDLRPHYKQGRTTRYHITASYVYANFFPGSTWPQRNYTSFNAAYTWHVKKVNDDGSAVATLDYDWWRMATYLGAGKTLAADSRLKSDEGVDPKWQKRAQAWANTTFTLYLKPNGQLRKVEGAKEFHKRLGDMPAKPSKRELFQQVRPAVPSLKKGPAAITVGDSWQYDQSMRALYGRKQGTIKTTVERHRPKAHRAVVAFDQTSDFTPVKEYLPEDITPENIQRTDAAVEGKAVYDMRRHETVHATYRAHEIYEIDRPEAEDDTHRPNRVRVDYHVTYTRLATEPAPNNTEP